MEELVKRVGRCEDDIKVLAKDVQRNCTSIEFFQRTVEKFEIFTEQCTKTLIGINNNVTKLNDKYDSLEREVGEIKIKVESNDEAHKLDTRSLFKKILQKVFVWIGVAAVIGGIIYWISTM